MVITGYVMIASVFIGLYIFLALITENWIVTLYIFSGVGVLTGWIMIASWLINKGVAK